MCSRFSINSLSVSTVTFGKGAVERCYGCVEHQAVLLSECFALYSAGLEQWDACPVRAGTSSSLASCESNPALKLAPWQERGRTEQSGEISSKALPCTH